MTLGVVLAAGASRRFGRDDKLLAGLDGRALVDHALQALQLARLDARAVVAHAPGVADLARARGIAVIEVATGGVQSDSLRAAVGHAQAIGASRLLIMLGDMPGVSVGDLDRLLAGPIDLARCTGDGDLAMPPAVFPAAWFDRLSTAQGDAGARPFLRAIPPEARLALAQGHLHDVDTPEDLARARPDPAV